LSLRTLDKLAACHYEYSTSWQLVAMGVCRYRLSMSKGSDIALDASRMPLVGVAVNAALAIVKILAGTIGNSYALIADGLESTWCGVDFKSHPCQPTRSTLTATARQNRWRV
jgi:hypothetical protein